MEKNMKKNKPNIVLKSFYKKNMPGDSPNKAFIFTDNLQAMCAAHPEWYNLKWMKEDDLSLNKVKTGVSDVNGTNQAGIRSMKSGTYGDNSIYDNSYGVVVKKYQQDKNGDFISMSGIFKDNEKDFSIFKEANEYVISKVKEKEYEEYVFPTQMAGRRACLPYRFAEWLRDKLKEEFNIDYKILYFTYYEYSGYKLITYL